MRRFITYIYEYEQGNRGRNTGFIRTDLRENSCRMELQIRGFDRFKGKCPVYLTVYENGLQAIPVTELLLTQGMGTCSFTCENNRIGNSGFDVHQAQTLTIACGNGRFLTGCLSSAPVPEALRGEFLIFSGKRSGTACRSGTDRAGHTDAIYNRTRAIPSAASHARTGTRPTAARHTRTGIHPAARNYSSTGNDPTAENNPSTRSSPAATNLLSESRNSGYPKASKKQLESVQQPFSSARFFQLSLSHVENAGNEWRKTTVSWNSGNL